MPVSRTSLSPAQAEEAAQAKAAYEAAMLGFTRRVRALFGTRPKAVAVQHQWRPRGLTLQCLAFVHLYGADAQPLEHDAPEGWPELAADLADTLTDGWHPLTGEFRLARHHAEALPEVP